MTEEFVDPSGHEWTVRRRWLPRLPGETLWGRFRKRFRRSSKMMGEWSPNVLDVPSGGDGIAGIVAGILAVIALVIFVIVVLPILFALVEVVVLVLLGLVILGARVLFRRPWTVEADRDDEVMTWQVVGWRASGEHVRRVAALLSDGVRPEGAEVRPNRAGRSPDEETP